MMRSARERKSSQSLEGQHEKLEKHTDPGDDFVPSEPVLVFHCPLELEFPVRREIRTAFFANVVLPLLVSTIRATADQNGVTRGADIDRLGVHGSAFWTLDGVAHVASSSARFGRVS